MILVNINYSFVRALESFLFLHLQINDDLLYKINEKKRIQLSTNLVDLEHIDV